MLVLGRDGIYRIKTFSLLAAPQKAMKPGYGAQNVTSTRTGINSHECDYEEPARSNWEAGLTHHHV